MGTLGVLITLLACCDHAGAIFIQKDGEGIEIGGLDLHSISFAAPLGWANRIEPENSA